MFSTIIASSEVLDPSKHSFMSLCKQSLFASFWFSIIRNNICFCISVMAAREVCYTVHSQSHTIKWYPLYLLYLYMCLCLYLYLYSYPYLCLYLYLYHGAESVQSQSLTLANRPPRPKLSAHTFDSATIALETWSDVKQQMKLSNEQCSVVYIQLQRGV